MLVLVHGNIKRNNCWPTLIMSLMHMHNSNTSWLLLTAAYYTLNT